MFTENAHPIKAQTVENDHGRVIGLEVSQLDSNGRTATWTFSVSHTGPNSGHFPEHFIRGPLLIDTSD